MMNTFRAIVSEGRIQLLEDIDLLEGTDVLVTSLLDETDFWRGASGATFDALWDNPEDNVYAQLLAE